MAHPVTIGRLVLTLAVWAVGSVAWAAPQPGDLVVVDFRAGTDQRGAVFVVNPGTGARSMLSDFGNPGQGPLGRDPYAIARGNTGALFVLDQRAGTDCVAPGFGCGALFVVDPDTGGRTLLSDFGNPVQGPTGLRPFQLALEGGGSILVMDQDAGGGPGKLFRVNQASGSRTVLSDFANAAQGLLGHNPSGVTVFGPDIIATDVGPTTATLLRVDPATGNRTLISDFYDPAQGPTGFVPIAVAPDPVTSQILVVEQLAGAGQFGFGSLFSVNPVNGQRTVITDFTTTVQGPLGFNPSGVSVTAAGEIRVVDFDAGTGSLGAVFRVDRATGQRSYLSDFGNAGQGPLGNEPSGLVIVPGGSTANLVLVAAILPSSRSVQVGATATAFVTVINTGASTAVGVGMALLTPIPDTFGYQTTDPATNALTGSPNTPKDIAAGGFQTYVVFITPTGPFAPVDLTFAFGGSNTAQVVTLVGINTLLLSASLTPVPDIVALVATVGGNGIVGIPGATGTGFFSVAAVNVGVDAAITVLADTGGAVLPLGVQICETNPVTGVCISALGPTVPTFIAAGATPTFAVFVTGTGFVPFDAAVNRIFLRFLAAGGIIRGSTSVAVRTE